ncbi:MAG: hypothetical protein JSR66_12050 [Proteobacteria bacterium]|nr:hypothetical protein [Pseudomonadota bacterium]
MKTGSSLRLNNSPVPGPVGFKVAAAELVRNDTVPKSKTVVADASFGK